MANCRAPACRRMFGSAIAIRSTKASRPALDQNNSRQNSGTKGFEAKGHLAIEKTMPQHREETTQVNEILA